MKGDAAPLYVRALDLARWLHPRAAERAGLGQAELWLAIAHSARELLVEFSLALSFRERRELHQRLADEELQRLRILVRLAHELGELSARRLRYVSAELDELGRMLGGWRRAARARHRKGAEAPAATPA